MKATVYEPEFVQSLKDEYGIGITLGEDNIDPVENSYDYYLDFSQYYGDKDQCDFSNKNECDQDGTLWRANDFGSPYFCTTHTFPMEQLGYQFIKSK